MVRIPLHTDDTPVNILAPGLKKTKTGRIWTYVQDDRNAGSSSPPAVWFAYSPNRQGAPRRATPPPLPGYPAGGCVHRLRQAVQCRT
ncbi:MULTISPECIES: IS66 family transposase [Escherichia]|uniref:IS66 family transposase n=1 Tax=Escherichia TaxID=561 RepID=UPI003855ECA5